MQLKGKSLASLQKDNEVRENSIETNGSVRSISRAPQLHFLYELDSPRKAMNFGFGILDLTGLRVLQQGDS